MPLTDELPLPPQTEDDEVPFGNAEFQTTANSSIFEGVGGLNDPIPAGPKHFRLDRYRKDIDWQKQPRFICYWKCQEEPHVGRLLFPPDYIQWLDADTLNALANKHNPKHAEAKFLAKKRLTRMNALMKAAGFTPKGDFDVETDFLATNPEVKIPVTVVPKKEKDTRETVDGKPNPDFGKYTVPTGEMQNGMPSTYLQLHRH